MSDTNQTPVTFNADELPPILEGGPLYGNVVVKVTDANNGQTNWTRYEFDLFSGSGTKRSLIVDVPHDENELTDVWVLDHNVEVGDTPEDGFASFTPATSEYVDPAAHAAALNETCRVCGQPDNCGDCTHVPVNSNN